DLLWKKRGRLPRRRRGVFAGVSWVFSKSGMHWQSGSLTNGAQTKTENADLSMPGNVIETRNSVRGTRKRILGPSVNAKWRAFSPLFAFAFRVCQMLSPRKV